MKLRSLVVVILISSMVTGCDFGNHERRVYAGVCVMPSQRTGSAAHVETDVVSQNRCAKNDALYAYTQIRANSGSGLPPNMSFHTMQMGARTHLRSRAAL